MDAIQFFLDQHQTVRGLVDNLVLDRLTEEQLRIAPRQGQNSLAWLLWHASRWEDVTMTLVTASQPQVLDQGDWIRQMNLLRRDTGTGMTAAECAELNTRIHLPSLRAYWTAVGHRTREAVSALTPASLDEHVDALFLQQIMADGLMGNERAHWLEQFLADHTMAWYLSYIVWHHAEHLFGEALCVRSQAGFPLGL
jgi:hypothetical protein